MIIDTSKRCRQVINISDEEDLTDEERIRNQHLDDFTQVKLND
jgi:hypothetical protein